MIENLIIGVSLLNLQYTYPIIIKINIKKIDSIHNFLIPNMYVYNYVNMYIILIKMLVVLYLLPTNVLTY